MRKDKKSTFAWIMEFAGQRKNKYIASVILAILGAVCQMLPFLIMARVIQKLLIGDTNFGGYITDC